jgi:hypothetical protein
MEPAAAPPAVDDTVPSSPSPSPHPPKPLLHHDAYEKLPACAICQPVVRPAQPTG